MEADKMEITGKQLRLKRAARISAICLGVYYIGILIFVTVTTYEEVSILEYFLFVLIGSVGLPIIGVCLALWGVHLAIRGGFEGLIPAAPLGLVLALAGGPAVALAFPIAVFLDESRSVLTIVNVVLILTLVLPVAFCTLLGHGGSDLVQKDDIGKGLKSLRDKLQDRLFESEDKLQDRLFD